MRIPFLRSAVLFVIFSALITDSCFSAEQISSEEFLSSRFGKFFQKKEYKKALKASDELLVKYPQDVLIIRYRALTLERLGRYDEAIKLYREIIASSPNYVPARLFLGLAYIKQGKTREAADVLRWVIKNSPLREYRRWAQAQLTRLRSGVRPAAKAVKKRPYFVGKTGFAYDSNPLLVPDNKALSVPGKKRDSALFLFSTVAGYPLWLKKDSRLDILYIGKEQFYDNGASSVDFVSQGTALDGKKRVFFGQQAVLFGGRYDFRANYLAGDTFSVINRFLLSADTSFWRRTRTHLYGRFALLEYNNDGSDPSRSSRDGGRGGLGLTQYFYSSDYKTFFFVKQELNFNQTHGDNFIRRGTLTRLGIHTPLKVLRNTVLDTSVGFDWGAYPDFSSLSALDTAKRRDARLDVYTSLTHYWMPNYATRIFYRFIDSNNRNDFYNRTRHIMGGEMLISF